MTAYARRRSVIGAKSLADAGYAALWPQASRKRDNENDLGITLPVRRHPVRKV
jgi:hypothetical protein